MTERRRALGRRLGALIPQNPAGSSQGTSRPVDVFFPAAAPGETSNDVSRETESNEDAPLVAVPGAEVALIPVADIEPNRVQPRTVLDEDEPAELPDSGPDAGLLRA